MTLSKPSFSAIHMNLGNKGLTHPASMELMFQIGPYKVRSHAVQPYAKDNQGKAIFDRMPADPQFEKRTVTYLNKYYPDVNAEFVNKLPKDLSLKNPNSFKPNIADGPWPVNWHEMMEKAQDDQPVSPVYWQWNRSKNWWEATQKDTGAVINTFV